MAQEADLVQYKDISDLKKELEGMEGSKDISTKEIHAAIQKLIQIMNDMLEIFGTAAEQMKLEEKEYESDAKKHEIIISKLDKMIDQNKTIAEGMVAIVGMVKEKLAAPAKERGEFSFKPKADPRLFMKPEPIMPRTQPVMPPPEMPPMQPTPLPDFDFPEEPPLLDGESKKKGIFGLFKK